MPERLKDRRWRMNNLYWIINEQGHRVKFMLTWSQQIMYAFMWYFNIVLKARQVRSTTFWCIFILDMSLFNSNIRAGIIAHNREEAEEVFEHKIKYPYNQIPEEFRAEIPSRQESTRKLSFANNSSIRVGTSLRSGTYAVVLITEHGKICAKYPERAKEIRTGTFPTVWPGQMMIIESTAEGREGDFYRMCTEARNNKIMGKELTQLDYKFFFLPWWKQPEYRMNPKGIAIPAELQEYFNQVEGMPIPPELHEYYGDGVIKLDAEQRAWYIKTYALLQDEMKREHPSTPDEAFEAAIIGAYYSKQMAKVRHERRIGTVAHDSFLKVFTGWDLGIGDEMVVWFYQVSGNQINLIDYYWNVGEGLDHFAMVLAGLEPGHEYKRAYNYGGHFAPHDIKERDILTARSQIDRAKKELSLDFTRIERTADIQNDINLVRRFLARCLFDEERCSRGIDCLDSFRKEWNEKMGCFSNRPLHNWASHGDAAFRTVARAVEKYPYGVSSSLGGDLTQAKADELRRKYGPPGVG